MPADDVLDCIIVGGGPAGLMAALYLARFRRRSVLLDAGASRLLWIPTSHNYPGYAHGIHGTDILQHLREQLAQYDVLPTNAAVDCIEMRPDDGFVVRSGACAWSARTVILATGVVDVAPDFPDVARAVVAGCLRYCPICDGFEAIGKSIAVVGRGKDGFGEAMFLRHYSDNVSLMTLSDEPIRLDEDERQQLAAAGIQIVEKPVKQVRIDGKTMRLSLSDDAEVHFDVVYVALGTLVNSGLAQALGAQTTAEGKLLVDAHQQTTVEGLYAAGDVVDGLNQIAVAMGHAAIAATAVHNRLRTAPLG